MNTTDFYCKYILTGKIKYKKELETDTILAYHHTKPHWTFHVVIIPKKHIENVSELRDLNLIKEIFEAAQKIIEKYDLENKNYKIITNGGEFQDSKHLHFHLVSGEIIKK